VPEQLEQYLLKFTYSINVHDTNSLSRHTGTGIVIPYYHDRNARKTYNIT